MSEITATSLRVALQEELRQEETLWKSKSRVQWLTITDVNTKFFHVSTVIRLRRNDIIGLKDLAGNWSDERQSIGNLLEAHFSSLYQPSQPPCALDLADLIHPMITPAENQTLCAVPSDGEIYQTVKLIGRAKASGLDGMTASFYQAYWQTVAP